MSVLITGGAGFIGSFLARSLLGRGENVVVLDAQLDDSPLRRILTAEEEKRVVQLRGDVADPTSFFRVVREQRVHRIVHLAVASSLRVDGDPWEGVRVNVMGTLTSFEAARLFDVERVVWASSVQVFGPHTAYSREFGDSLTDDGPHRPWNVYSSCKSLCEHMGSHYHRKFGLDLRGLRPAGTFGPGRMPGLTTYVTDMIQAAAAGRPYTMPNAGQALPHLYVEDCARAFELALCCEGDELSGRTLNIGAHPTTHGEMAEIVRRVVPGADITTTPGDGGDPVVLPIDNSTFARITGFKLEFSLEEGVRRTIEWFRGLA